MARSPFATDIYDTPQKSIRTASPIGYIIIHHAATLSYDAVIQLEMGAREVSSTLIVKDDRVASMFDEYYRAWSLSSAYWDSVSLSVETCNDNLAPKYEISEASQATLAKVVADWCKRYGIPCNRQYIMGHNEVYTRYGASYATACPGGINLDRVVQLANEILNGGSSEKEEEDMIYRIANLGNGRFIAMLVTGSFAGIAYSDTDAAKFKIWEDTFGFGKNRSAYTVDAAYVNPENVAALAKTIGTTVTGDITVDNTKVLEAINKLPTLGAIQLAVTSGVSSVIAGIKSLLIRAGS